MKYLLMINNNPAVLAALSEADQKKLWDRADALTAELAASGELVGAQALADIAQAKTVRIRGGALATTDGPFAEAKEYLAGFLIVDCATEERALEIAARWPDAEFGAMEVRAIAHSVGPDGS